MSDSDSSSPADVCNVFSKGQQDTYFDDGLCPHCGSEEVLTAVWEDREHGQNDADLDQRESGLGPGPV